jgi:transglutaminase-like putative cysteine protease
MKSAMSVSVNDDQTRFLADTRFTDFSSDIIKRAAQNITFGCHNDKERAMRIFYWIRDNIVYKIGLYKHTASETLLAGYGSCSNKANLFSALTRSIGIPSGFNIMRVNAQEYFGPISSPRLSKFMSASSVHVYNSVYIQGRWVSCDLSDDIRLSLCGEHIWPQVRRVDFDGQNDALLNIDASHIQRNSEDIIDNIDFLLMKETFISKQVIEVLNDYADYLRKFLILYNDWNTVLDDFLDWYRFARPRQFQMFIEAEAAFELAMASRNKF